MTEENIQKYNKGDHVRVAQNLGECRDHFQSDCEAVILYTYNEKYGGGDIDSYGIHIKGRGQTAWYYERDFTLIEAGRLDILEQWEIEEQDESDMKADLDWIFSHGDDVLKAAHGSTVSALAKCFGFTDLWGANGEGFTYHMNAMSTLVMARPFLELGDKYGWVEHCKSLMAEDKS